ncbi:D-serine ammonia-lyase (plasmid) [Paroceanicella profunda]|uniref:Probable D-serine dehydratase n=1 Tax=Paroceanicella profunda TaxID=2579971 RepID=A0A5B8FJX1_9RHOB|nr:D-serine ammonia-lyase [Paroceanicella profunda]QDL94967.1 D-serine ammonia-lyase [Paroceanicella profunda]
MTAPETPVLARVRAGQPTLWTNPDYAPEPDPEAAAGLATAVADWQAIAPLLAALFPELGPAGTITSDLIDIGALRAPLGYDTPAVGPLLLKADHALPVAGSVKARGGVFEVVMTAIAQARAAGLLRPGESPAALLSPQARAFFAARSVAVGSTGNLGLSVGIAARALGYRAVVHMSADAKAWKVERLRALGVEVVRHAADYTSAVAAARAASEADPLSAFVDDEDSELLFRGYSAAARELAGQLDALGLTIGPERPLLLYLPCGIGGAPGGVAWGARGMFGPDVHPFFVEPVQSPSALVQMARGVEVPSSVYDLGLSNRTEADGMAVATMSALVARRMTRRLAGVFTVGDDDLLRSLALAHDTAGLRLEPSAAAGFAGPHFTALSPQGAGFRARHLPPERAAQAVHVVWATGGSFVPDARFRGFLDAGRALGTSLDFSRT